MPLSALMKTYSACTATHKSKIVLHSKTSTENTVDREILNTSSGHPTEAAYACETKCKMINYSIFSLLGPSCVVHTNTHKLFLSLQPSGFSKLE